MSKQDAGRDRERRRDCQPEKPRADEGVAGPGAVEEKRPLRPARSVISVVLPEPLLPTRPKTSPAATVSDTPLSALTGAAWLLVKRRPRAKLRSQSAGPRHSRLVPRSDYSRPS